MLRRALLGVSRSDKIKQLVTTLPVTSGIVSRYVAGESVDDVIAATERLVGAGLTVSIDHLGEDTTDSGQADRVVRDYRGLLSRLGDAHLTGSAEVSIKLTALGMGLGDAGRQIALDNARMVCVAAQNAGTAVTLDMEDHTTTDDTLAILAELRRDFPDTGAVIQAHLHRSESDLHNLTGAGSRVRLCKGAYKQPESVAFQDKAAVDKAYVRCLKILMSGDGYPMVATHDPRLIAIAQDLAQRNHRELDTYEFQMLYGIRPTEQQRLANRGHRMRVYVPYGTDWYGYLVRRLAERPANLAFFARSLISKG